MTMSSMGNSVKAFDGELTLKMLPFHSLAVDLRVSDLNRMFPQFEYRNVRTGVVQNAVPVGFDDKMAQVERLQLTQPDAAATVLEQYEWKRERLWRQSHDCYAIVLPLIIEATFHEPHSPHVLAFMEYWNNRSNNLAEDWQRFLQSTSIEMRTALWLAYASSLDNKLSAPENDPNSVGSGGNTETNTGAA